MLVEQLHDDHLYTFWRDQSGCYQTRTSERLELEEEDPPVVKVTNIIDKLEIGYNIIYLNHATTCSSIVLVVFAYALSISVYVSV